MAKDLIIFDMSASGTRVIPVMGGRSRRRAGPTHFVARPANPLLCSTSPSPHKTSLTSHQTPHKRILSPLQMSSHFSFFVVCTVLALDSVHALNTGGSCKDARLCCPGRDTSCGVQKSKSNEITDELVDRVCYCDSACTSVGDCCFDYEQTCGVSDCEVSEWGPWSGCDVDCGLGTMSRERKVVKEARNGGDSCPELIQRRGCSGANCEISRAALKASRESALILPSSYSNLKTVNETLDIRKNLRVKYPKDPLRERSSEYCVVFEVTKSRKGCEAAESPVHRLLVPGQQVCVSCASAAMRKHLGYRCHGHGVDDQQTRFSSVSAENCHGRWIRKAQYDLCPCHSDARPDFIFI